MCRENFVFFYKNVKLECYNILPFFLYITGFIKVIDINYEKFMFFYSILRVNMFCLLHNQRLHWKHNTSMSTFFAEPTKLNNTNNNKKIFMQTKFQRG